MLLCCCCCAQLDKRPVTRSPSSCPHSPLGGSFFLASVVQTEDGMTKGREGAGRLSQDRVGKCEQRCNWSGDLCQVTSESLARSLSRVGVHRHFVPHPSVCFLRIALSLFSQQPMMSSQLCSSSPRNPKAFRRLFSQSAHRCLQRGVFDG